MKICLVTAFPPSRRGLSEYGFHIACELQRNPFVSLTVLADRLSSAEPEPEGFSVVRCWSFGSPSSLYRLLAAIRESNPDVVWFNLLYTTFGHNPLAAFSGLAVPLLTRLSGRYTHVTLHHLMDTIDLRDAGVRFPRVYRQAGAVATRMLLRSNSVTVLMPSYRRVLLDNYGPRNVRVRAHGVFSQYPEHPNMSYRGNPVHRILAFGKWGTYKRLEPTIEAFRLVAKRMENVRLVIAGDDHPRTPGYVASVANRFHDPAIEFTGYVPEENVANLFRAASVVIMPYSSSTGSSGVAHLACTYGVPIISADIPDFRQMANSEGLAMDFYEPGNIADLADRLIVLLESPDQQEAMAKQNFAAALRMTMPHIVSKYVRQFDMDQRTKTLKSIMRLRRLPRWLPWRHLAGARAFQNRFSWAEHPATAHSPGGRDPSLVNRDGQWDRSLDGTSATVDRQSVRGGSWSESVSAGLSPAAGHTKQSQAQHGRDEEDLAHPPPAWGSDDH